MKHLPLPLPEPEHEIVAFCPCGCGALVLVAADYGQPDKPLEKEIAALIREGGEVKRVSRGEAKQLLTEKHFGCLKPKLPATPDGQLLLPL